jgi:predicted ATPase with chaperone activity
LSFEDITDRTGFRTEKSQAVKARVTEARKIQVQRFKERGQSKKHSVFSKGQKCGTQRQERNRILNRRKFFIKLRLK